MATKSHITEVQIANALIAIFERLDHMEDALQRLAGPKHLDMSQQVQAALLVERLGHITLKRHAVLTATLGGLSYAQIAKMMGCNVTTVKLHLKCALESLGINGRSCLLAEHSQLLADISEETYLQQFHISKTWWLVQDAGLMAVLCRTKATANQHTSTPHVQLPKLDYQPDKDGGTDGGTED
jgi:DNA-binding CsgD family transcriptional regulator